MIVVIPCTPALHQTQRLPVALVTPLLNTVVRRRDGGALFSVNK